MRRSLAIAAMASLAAAAVISGYSTPARSADHQDAPGVRAEPAADINDVYTWMDGTNVVLAMTTYPDAMTGQTFSNAVQYVFHTGSGIAFSPALPTGGVDVIATFDNATPQNIQLWVGNPASGGEYVTGNANVTAGLASADGKVKVYAGLVADPFFFNLDGFKSVVSDVEGVEGQLGQPVDAGGIALTPYGCPELGTGAQTLAVQLAHAPGGIDPPTDHFANFNGLVIVVSVDKTLLTANGPAVSVWAGTYATPTSADAGGE